MSWAFMAVIIVVIPVGSFVYIPPLKVHIALFAVMVALILLLTMAFVSSVPFLVITLGVKAHAVIVSLFVSMFMRIA